MSNGKIKVTKKDIESKEWRLFNLYAIINKDGHRQTFKPNSAQKRFLRNKHGFNIILKSRQIGFSTLIEIDMLDDCLFTPNFNAGVIAQTEDDAKSLFRRKVLFAYDNLPEVVKSLIPTVRRSETEIEFSNGSFIRVGTSLRGGTPLRVHVSEFGKISNVFPDRAREIITGTFEAVPKNGRIDVESTAEGSENAFHKMVLTAQALREEGRDLLPGEFKLHFFPWMDDETCQMQGGAGIKPQIEKYFQSLSRSTGRVFTQSQKLFYQVKRASLSNEIFREYPSTEDEAFQVNAEGAIWGAELEKVYEQHRIGGFPYEARLGAVYTFWDIGRNDLNVIWFGQEEATGRLRLFKCISDQFKSLPYYAQKLIELRQQHGWTYGGHFLPHDGNNTDVSVNQSRKEILENILLQEVSVIPRAKNIQAEVNTVRPFIYSCTFDATGCATGFKMLQNYQWKYDKGRGIFTDKPEHKEPGHYADAFRTAANAQRLNLINPHVQFNAYEEAQDYENVSNVTGF